MAKTKRKEAPANVGIKQAIVEATAKINENAAKLAALPPLVKLVKPSKTKAAPKLTVVPSVHSKSTPKSNNPPTLEIAAQLQRAFDHFNGELFKDNLSPAVVVMQRLRKYNGQIAYKQWSQDRKAGALDGSHHEIRLNPDRLRNNGDKEVLSTLVHEMVHQLIFDEHFKATGKIKKSGYHCANWCDGMRLIGLSPVIMDKNGNVIDKPTGPNATHTIKKDGLFDNACNALLAKGFKLDWCLVPQPEKKEGKAKKKAGVKVKYTADCDTSFWGKGGIVATCQCGCDSKFVSEDDEGSDE